MGECNAKCEVQNAKCEMKIDGKRICVNAVECLLMLREVFRFPYRQTEGLARSLIALMQVEIDVPDYSSLAKRAGKLSLDLGVARRGGAIDWVVDSTGLKVFGEGEWKVR